MTAPVNGFKRRLAGEGGTLHGFWLSLASEGTAELLAGSGADFVVVDGEHAPNDLDLMRRGLMAAELGAARGETQIVARSPINEAWVIKQLMDAGARSLIVPMVDTPEQAEAAARAMRFPPEGNRGVAGGTRASGYGRIPDYLTTANAQACCIVQIESRTAVDNLEAIAAVEGVDGLFIGPNDLSASYGFLGATESPEMESRIEEVIGRINAAGKASCILAFNPATALRYRGYGARMVVVGSDTTLLTAGAGALLSEFRGGGAGGA